MYRRRRRSVALAAALVVVALATVNQLGYADSPRPATTPAATAAPPSATSAAEPVLRPEVPTSARTAASRRPVSKRPTTVTHAAANFTYVADAGPVLGMGGQLRKFRVAVQAGVGQDADRFAASVDRILGDPRSWIGSGRLRLQRVPRSADAEFVILLASGTTSERLCAEGGLHTEGFTSCRLPGKVIINLDRWRRAIPDYGAPLATYQAYAVNHEVGHQLGHGHELCPGRGEPAPVMQQQTYGLKGCVANPWPYLDGKRYTGPAT